jgi:hypothetical protein
MGLLEFSVPTIRVVETNYSYFAIVRRTFELKGQVRIDYELQNSEPLYCRMEDMRGTLIFDEGVEERYIVGRIFKRHKYEYDDYLSTFQI